MYKSLAEFLASTNLLERLTNIDRALNVNGALCNHHDGVVFKINFGPYTASCMWLDTVSDNTWNVQLSYLDSDHKYHPFGGSVSTSEFKIVKGVAEICGLGN